MKQKASIAERVKDISETHAGIYELMSHCSMCIRIGMPYRAKRLYEEELTRRIDHLAELLNL